MVEEVVEVPQGVELKVENHTVFVKNDKEENSRRFKAKGIDFVQEGNKLRIVSEDKSKKTKAVMNAIHSHINNMVKGLTKEFEYKLSIVYSHFPMSVSVKGDKLEVSNILGSKKVKSASIVGRTKVEVKGKEIFVRGHSKEDVGQTAANIERTGKTKGRDRRIFQDGIFLVAKGEK